LEQIELIRTFSLQGQEVFRTSVLIQSAILHRLALLGEACRALSSDLRDSHPEVPWNQIVAFRNVVIHEYFGIDLDLVWTVVADEIPQTARALRSILASLPE
jgi:uncharacterized protein with HEPN domain